MSINYISLMLINMVARLVLLAAYIYRGLDSPDQKQWIPGFAIAGSIALATGLPIVLTWPVAGSFNIAFGETTVLFGALFLITAIALAMDWGLMTVAVYAFFAGIAAIVIGVRSSKSGYHSHCGKTSPWTCRYSESLANPSTNPKFNTGMPSEHSNHDSFWYYLPSSNRSSQSANNFRKRTAKPGTSSYCRERPGC